METASESAVPAVFDAVDGSILQVGGPPAPAAAPGLVAGPGEIVVGPVALSREPAGRGRHRVTARRLTERDVVAMDTIDLARAGQRQRLIKQVLEKLGPAEPDAEALGHGLDQALLALASAPAQSAGPAGAAAPGPEFMAIEGDGDGLEGLFTTTPPAQISNFVMRISDKVLVADEDGEECRLRLVLRRRGRQHAVELSAAEFASNGRLRAAVFGSPLPGADLKAGADVLRRAAIALSDPAIRRVTTATGWTADRSRFLAPGGYVDADGFRADEPESGLPRVDLSACEGARWLGLRRLDDAELAAVKRHFADEFIRLHDPGVMHALLGAAALTVLRAFASPKSRPVVWLLGLSGSGKTFLASLLMNLFGDFPLDADGRIPTWGSTANYLQALGYYHRDMLLVLDDFKPEVARHGEVVRLLQNTSDGAARGRLRHDARARATRPIRGQVLATGEDFPAQNASGRARTIVVPVPNREKDLELGRRCAAMAPLYRGLMADFLAWVIREGRGAVFAERAEHWQGEYYASIAGRQNDARVAGNHALLAAAFEQMAAYLADAWPGAMEAAESFAAGEVAAMVAASAGAAEEEQGSSVFLNELRALLEWGRVRLEAPGGAAGEKGRGGVVGRVAAADGEVVELSVALALAAVQRSLRKQGKPALAVSQKTLIAQWEAEGLLLDRANRPIVHGWGGSHSRQVRIERKRVRVVRIRREDLLDRDEGAV